MNINPTYDNHETESPICKWCDETIEGDLELTGVVAMHPGCMIEYANEIERVENERNATNCTHCHEHIHNGESVITHAVGVIHESCEDEVNIVLGLDEHPDNPNLRQRMELFMDEIVTMVWPNGNRARRLRHENPELYRW